MHRVILAIMVVLLWGCAREIPTATLVIDNVSIIDVRDGSVDENMMLVIDGDRIRAVGRSGSLRVPDGTPTVDGTGRFAIPGLWDMHVHALEYGLPRSEPFWYETFLKLFVAHGVTGFRDMWGDLELAQRLRTERASGDRLVPRFVMAGHVVVGPNSAGRPNTALVATPADARRVVDSLVAAGAGFIKVTVATPEIFQAIANEAKRAGIRFAGHVPSSVRAADAAEAGQWTMEHLYGVLQGCSSAEDELLAGSFGSWQELVSLIVSTQDSARCDRLMQVFVDNETWQVPTLVAHRGLALMNDHKLTSDPGLINDPRLEYMPSSATHLWVSRVSEWTDDDSRTQRESLALLSRVTDRVNRAGVPILAGSDTPNPYAFPGSGLHDELELLVEAGLTPIEALQTATLNPARFLGATDSLGSLDVDRVADIVLLDANPLEDINNIRQISAVVLAGKLLDREDLDALLTEVEAMVSQTEARPSPE